MDKEDKEEIINNLNKRKGYVNCKTCGKEHQEIDSNCCWIYCKCGERICGMCGSTNIVSINDEDLDLSDGSDDNYWCCNECENCGLQGCGMCV